MTTFITLLLILVMVGFNALYVAAEFATVGSRRSRVQESADSDGGQAKLIAVVNGEATVIERDSGSAGRTRA